MDRILICCGARCGAEPKHRRIFDAVEHAADRAGFVAAPTLCRAMCGFGVTVILPDSSVRKVLTPETANSVLDGFCPP